MFKKSAVLRDILIIASVVILCAGVFAVTYRLVSPGGAHTAAATNDITLDWEGRLKDLLREQVVRESTVITKAPVRHAIDTIMHRLLANAANLPSAPEIIVIDSPVVNAYTFPGGMIVVTSGLLRDAANAEEVSAVLAHELGHVANRDPAALIIRQTGLSIIMSVITGGNPTVVHDIVRQAVNSHYSRQQENSADEYACRLMIRSGVHPRHCASFFRKLMGKYKRTAEKILEPLATHPATERRIANAERLGREFKGDERPLPVNWATVRAALPSAFDGSARGSRR